MNPRSAAHAFKLDLFCQNDIVPADNWIVIIIMWMMVEFHGSSF